jgi:hypothetical protein
MQMELFAKGQKDLQVSLDELKPRNKSAVSCKPLKKPVNIVEIPKANCDPENLVQDGEVPMVYVHEGPISETVPRLGRSGSTSSLASDTNRTLEMAEENLKTILQENHENEERKHHKFQKALKRGGSRLSQAVVSLDWQELEFGFDTIVALVIFCNAVYVGVSLDYADDSPGWLVGEFIFAITFWLELLLKLKLHGWRSWYFGMSGTFALEKSNIFDTFIVLADTVQLLVTLGPAEWGEGVFKEIPISVFRLVRLIRLTRVLRLFRSNMFRDLFAMVQGMTCGVTTLGWAVMFFLLFIYFVSLICKEMLGSAEVVRQPGTFEAFNTVPHSMFTVFRCSFGDCSTADGTPLFASNPDMWSIFYSLFTFVVVVGIFNVISAIFVESTLASAKNLTGKKLQARLDNPSIWSVNVTKVLKVLLIKQGMDKDELTMLEQGKCSHDLIRKLRDSEFPRALFEEVVSHDEDVKAALSALDICSEENAHLSDLLDPDKGGSIGCLELVDGLKRLRGDPRRGDIISVDLMIRSLQVKVDQIWHGMNEIRSKRTWEVDVDNLPATAEISENLSDNFWFAIGG